MWLRRRGRARACPCALRRAAGSRARAAGDLEPSAISWWPAAATVGVTTSPSSSSTASGSRSSASRTSSPGVWRPPSGGIRQGEPFEDGIAPGGARGARGRRSQLRRYLVRTEVRFTCGDEAIDVAHARVHGNDHRRGARSDGHDRDRGGPLGNGRGARRTDPSSRARDRTSALALSGGAARCGDRRRCVSVRSGTHRCDPRSRLARDVLPAVALSGSLLRVSPPAASSASPRPARNRHAPVSVSAQDDTDPCARREYSAPTQGVGGGTGAALRERSRETLRERSRAATRARHPISQSICRAEPTRPVRPRPCARCGLDPTRSVRLRPCAPARPCRRHRSPCPTTGGRRSRSASR